MACDMPEPCNMFPPLDSRDSRYMKGYMINTFCSDGTKKCASYYFSAEWSHTTNKQTGRRTMITFCAQTIVRATHRKDDNTICTIKLKCSASTKAQPGETTVTCSVKPAQDT